MDAITTRPGQAHAAPIGYREFVALIAATIAMGAIGIDSMLPALPAIARSLRVANVNHGQFVISVFLFGFGVGQLVHGPLADRYGRRPVLIASTIAYVIATVACAMSQSFALLLVARLLGGMVIAATRVVTVAIVRDCYSGRAMARVMSTTFIVFMIVPVLAPSLGQAVLLVGGWREIFWIVAALSLMIGTWFAARMPETLHPADRTPLSVERIAAGARQTLRDRLSLGYTLASGAMMGGMYGYLNSISQIMADVWHRPGLLAALFASVAATMAVSNFLNAWLVVRFGTRLLSHGAVCVLMVVAATHFAVNATGTETLAMFWVLQGLTMACFGLVGTNFSTMAMTNMGHIAGTASSVQGFASSMLGTVIGLVIGQAFDGSAGPMIAGFVLAGVAALVLAAATERGHLFRAA